MALLKPEYPILVQAPVHSCQVKPRTHAHNAIDIDTWIYILPSINSWFDHEKIFSLNDFEFNTNWKQAKCTVMF